MFPFLMYMTRRQPDIAQQLMVLGKFHRFLFRVYKDLQKKESLSRLKTLVHGDAKIDNFMLKKVYGENEVLACFGDSCKDFNIIEDSELAAELIKEGFTLEFMKNALIKPVLSLKNKSLLLDWWKQVEAGNTDVELPPESEIFKSENYSSFIFLYFKMATEVNVFSHLGQTLFAHMKESLFSDKVDEDSDDEEDLEENDNVESVDKPFETEEDKESTLETNGSSTEEV